MRHLGVPDEAQAPLVVENGTDIERITFVSPHVRTGGVLFVGSLHHPPNVEAALRLTLHIMPRVWALAPDLSLTIVGGHVPRTLEQSARRASGRVELTGRVADVVPFLSRHRVFANPIRSGAGSSLKTVEALAAGIPLVSTEHGVRGFELIANTQYWKAESDDEFARAIVDAARGANRSAEIASAGRARAEQFSWSALGERFANRVLETFR